MLRDITKLKRFSTAARTHQPKPISITYLRQLIKEHPEKYELVVIDNTNFVEIKEPAPSE